MGMGGRSKSHGGAGWQGQPPPFMDGPEDNGFLYPRDGGAPQNVPGGHGNSAMIVTPQQGKYQPYQPNPYQGAYSRSNLFDQQQPLMNPMGGLDPEYGISGHHNEQDEHSGEHLAEMLQHRRDLEDSPRGPLQ